jgi:acetyl-CoA C-acetyltransferase
VALSESYRQLVLALNRAKTASERLRVLAGFRPSMFRPSVPNVNERRTGLSMGEHCELMVKQWGITREAQDELALASHRNGIAAYEEGFYDDLVVPFQGLQRDNNLRPDTVMAASQRAIPHRLPMAPLQSCCPPPNGPTCMAYARRLGWSTRKPQPWSTPVRTQKDF